MSLFFNLELPWLSVCLSLCCGWRYQGTGWLRHLCEILQILGSAFDGFTSIWLGLCSFVCSILSFNFGCFPFFQCWASCEPFDLFLFLFVWGPLVWALGLYLFQFSCLASALPHLCYSALGADAFSPQEIAAIRSKFLTIYTLGSSYVTIM